MINKSMRLVFCSTAIAIAGATAIGIAQRGAPLTAEQTARRWEMEKELQSIAIVERKVMMPMRDGKRMAADVYRPKERDETGTRSSLCGRLTTSISGTCATACRAT